MPLVCSLRIVEADARVGQPVKSLGRLTVGIPSASQARAHGAGERNCETGSNEDTHLRVVLIPFGYKTRSKSLPGG